MAQEAIRFCEMFLDGTQVGLEWGSGRSTLWFGERMKRLLSIEYDPLWHEKVINQIQKKGYKHIKCCLVRLEHSLEEPTKPFYDKQPAYVSIIEDFEDESLDFVVVDGHYRQACILAALPKLKSKGCLLVDNTNWLPIEEWGVPPKWLIMHQSSNVLTQTTIWQKP
ncbi:MAG: hypothetical protein A2Y62_14420 [Candidatus Fischerbacteria bacterium RBG_13_37_8]|uniref:Class I SAM-dependent methyltransferase n=1 Tax=Candidatus Fischerbacteria bacterium RBG_13_37_8 TaxID=1817863 RepID=A0A1F5VNN5_9BACT|nr:MAG: hypothetical protein A2Y62_14420 [Candidatus Fischerbacteria bacterium RBG_13_37_8]